MRRHFTPYSEDFEFLESRGAPWEALTENNNQWYILHDYEPPQGYLPRKVKAAFRLPSSYPSTQIDMIYFYPHLIREDGKSISRVSNLSFDGEKWQQWSRHRLSSSDWKDGVDYLATHIAYIDGAMKFEVTGE